jgi:hypothetical protein
VKLTNIINFEISDILTSNILWHVGVASAIGQVARKLLLGGFVAGSLFIHNSQPLLEHSRGRETWLKRQTSATTIAHALLTDIARTLQTAVNACRPCTSAHAHNEVV